MFRSSYFAICALLLASTFAISAHAEDPGRLQRSYENPAVYYVLNDGRRFTFPNEAIFRSWFSSFDTVEMVPATTLAQAQLVGNVFFHPGTLIKIATDPKVYLVTRGGQLHWIETEAVAVTLFGPGWASQVHDLSDAFFSTYSFGSSVPTAAAIPVIGQITSIADNQNSLAAPLPVASQPTSTTSTCQTFSCAYPLAPQRYDSPGATVISTVAIGKSLPIGSNLYIRNEGVTNGLLAYTVWNKTPRGCRIVHNMGVPVGGAGVDGDIGDIMGDTFTEINSSPSNELIVKKSSGVAGFNRCTEYYTTAHQAGNTYTQCQLLPHPGAWVFRDGEDERTFDESQWNLRDYMRYSLFAQKKILARTRQAFPAFAEAFPNMTALRGSLRTPTGVSGLAHIFGFYFTSNQAMTLLSDQEQLRYSQISDDLRNSVETLTNAEPHEPWHVLLSSTQLGRWSYTPVAGQNQITAMLVEGVAEYLRGPSNPGLKRDLTNWCQATRLEDTHNHRSIAYTDPAIDLYTKGSCFFTRIEQVCGLPTLNSTFRTLLNQAYEPNATYPHVFGVVDSYCPDHEGYRQLLTDFGFSADVLSVRQSLAPGLPISNDNACQD